LAGDGCLDAFLSMFETNITLLKITWRLESRKSFALNKLITRNNEIDRYACERGVCVCVEVWGVGGGLCDTFVAISCQNIEE
jgi:hypothetical protein